MKRLIILMALAMLSTASFAQYSGYSTETMTMKNGALWLGEEKVTQKNVAAIFPDQEFQTRWDRANSGYKAGLGMTIGGAILCAGGGYLFYCCGKEVKRYYENEFFASIFNGNFAESMSSGTRTMLTLWYGSLAMAGVGVPLLISGVPVLCVNRSQMKKLAESYNSTSPTKEITLSFGTQQHGIGFALNF